ncbi:MAG: hypothetical protein ACTTJ7_06610 [Treponema sp.]
MKNSTGIFKNLVKLLKIFNYKKFYRFTQVSDCEFHCERATALGHRRPWQFFKTIPFASSAPPETTHRRFRCLASFNLIFWRKLALDLGAEIKRKAYLSGTSLSGFVPALRVCKAKTSP